MNLPRFPKFKLVGLEDRSLISDMIARNPSEVCELNFGNIFLWRHFEHSKLTLIQDNLCILCEPPSEPAYFLQPLGDQKIEETLATCLSFAPRVSRVAEDFAVRYGAAGRLESDRDNFDYVYRVDDLTLLQGKKYDGKRNRIRKFEKLHNHRYLRLAGQHLEGCRRLLDEWLAVKANGDSSIAGTWKQVIEEAFDHLDDLGLTGSVIETDGRVAAFAIGERLNADTAVIHIEITHPGYEGLSQLINREFVKNEWAGFRFVNREQDNGIPGLRRAKMSYYPHHLVKKYNIWG